MAEEEKNENVEETPQDDADGSAAGPADDAESQTEEPAADEAAPEEEAAEAPAEEEEAAEAPAETEPEASTDDELADLPWKDRRRILRSREPAEARPQRSPEEREAERARERGEAAAARRRYRQGRGKKGEPGTGTPPAEHEPNASKMRQGVVVSDKADKTIVVRIDITRRHPTYEKVVRRSRTLHAHDERNEAGEGDTVRVIETRPLSRSKRWRLVEVIEKAR
jgi:small subunit ribosomal protein S17